MSIVLVCGGRDYTDYWTVHDVLNGQHRLIPILSLIEGGALGADRFARKWAELNGVPVETVEADWKRHGRAAGPIRNQEMLTLNPDLIIAFPGGRGTANMVSLAKAQGVYVREITA